jgi:hypothetical protein
MPEYLIESALIDLISHRMSTAVVAFTLLALRVRTAPAESWHQLAVFQDHGHSFANYKKSLA